MNAESIAQMILDGCDTSEQVIRAAVTGAPYVIRAAIDSHILTKFLPGFAKQKLVDLAMAAVKKVADVMFDALALFRLYARSVGRPSLLRAAAETLSARVQTAGTNLGTAMTPTALRALDDDAWDSPAKTSYSTAFSEQTRSTDRIPEVSRDLELTLNNMADSIEGFFVELQWSLLGFGLAAVGLGIAIASAPTGVGPIIGLVVTILGVIQAIGSIIFAFTNAANRNSADAERLASSPTITWADSAFAS